MKNLKIKLENGITVTKLDTTIKLAKEFAVNAEFNPNNLEFKILDATAEEIKKEQIRLQEIDDEYNQVCDYNKKVNRYNSAIVKSTNHHEFMNAVNHLS